MTSISDAHAAQIRYQTAQVAKYEAQAIAAVRAAELAYLDRDPKIFVAAAALADYANRNVAAARNGLLIAEYAAQE